MNKNQSWKRKTVSFLSAQTISLFGSSIVQYAIVWYITLSTSSGKMLTISTICGFLPQIMISLFAGVWIDRYDRKKLIMISDSIIALFTFILAIAFINGYKNIWLVFVVLAIRSAGTGIQTPSVNAILPQIVPSDKLMRVNGIHSTLSSIIMFISPAFSGFILSLFSLETTLFIDVVTAIIGVTITSTISIQRIYQKQSSTVQGLKEGYTYLKDNVFIRRLIIFQFLTLLLITPSAFLTPLMVSRSFGNEVWRLTLSEMTYSLGMISGGLLISLWGGFKNRTKTIIIATTMYGLIMIFMGAAPYFIIYLILNALIGISSPCYNTSITVSIQERVESSMHGRVFSFMQIATSCAFPLGMLIYGPLADYIPVQILIISSGILVLIMIIFIQVKKYLKS
ncbi:MAG: MFS transporter [Coprobacillus sp.]